MKKTNVMIASILASVVGLGSVTAMAQGDDGERSWKNSEKQYGKRGGRHGGMHMMKRMAKKLELTDDQKAQLKTMRETRKADNQVLRDQMKQLRQDMQNLDPTDGAAVAALATRKGALAEQMFIARNNARVAFESILTDKQKAKLAEMKAKRQARRAERMKKRQERRAEREADNAS